MKKKWSHWILNLDPKDKAAFTWLDKYYRDRRKDFIPRTDIDLSKSLKDHVINLYERDNDHDHRFLRNLKAAYEQFEKRRNAGDKVSRTFEISVESDAQLSTMSGKTDVSKNSIIDTLIRESANVHLLFTEKTKERKKLTVKDIINPFAKEMGVGDFIFGRLTFPDEAALGKKVYGFIDKLNKQANANSDKVDPLAHDDVLTLMIREGILHNINKSIASRSAPGWFGRKMTSNEVKRTIDELRIDDVFELPKKTTDKLARYRHKFEKLHYKQLNIDVIKEDIFIDQLVSDALNADGFKHRINNLEQRVAELSGANRELERDLNNELKDLRFNDEEMEHQRAIIDALGHLVTSLVEERNKAQDALISHQLVQSEGRDSRQPSRFDSDEIPQSIKSFRSLVNRAKIGSVAPEEITSVEFPSPQMPYKAN